MMQQNIDCSSKIKPPRIEVKTLLNLAGDESDKQLAAHLNDGWEVLHAQVNSVAVGVGAASVRHFEIIKLTRLVEEDLTEEHFCKACAATGKTISGEKCPDCDGKGIVSVQVAEAVTVENAATYAAEVAVKAGLVEPPKKVVTGAVFGMDVMNSVIDGTTQRESVETVTFTAALRSGMYTPEEMREIGNREALAAGLRVVTERQRWGQREWTGLVNRLPSRIPLSHMSVEL